MSNRLLAAVLLAAQLVSGCASPAQQTTLAQSPDDLTEAIARQGEADPTPTPSSEPRHPDSPRWSYVMSKMEDVAKVIVCLPLFIVGLFAEGKTNGYNLQTRP